MQTFTIGVGPLVVDPGRRRNPLVRRSDRIEFLVLSFAVLLTVVAVPVAGAIGTSCMTHGRGSTPRRR